MQQNSFCFAITLQNSFRRNNIVEYFLATLKGHVMVSTAAQGERRHGSIVSALQKHSDSPFRVPGRNKRHLHIPHRPKTRKIPAPARTQSREWRNSLPHSRILAGAAARAAARQVDTSAAHPAFATSQTDRRHRQSISASHHVSRARVPTK
jgi:hypothetical protein